ncbi:MAG: glycosyltransferase [Planctomycetota bacterium]|jgi:glycosyltransferase involved in cell wall biosynthesis
MSTEERKAFRSADRPHVAMITNHGYAGAVLPTGGAPDTGGQNFYVNSLAATLDELGYKTTVFARGGFHHFRTDRKREAPEFLTPHVRYVYIQDHVPEFICKEDIACVLDEELEWLDRFVREEASQAACPPWELFEFVSTHYWDAAVLGVYLVERWKNDVAHDWASRLLAGRHGPDLQTLEADRHHLTLHRSLPMVLGKLMLGARPKPPAELTEAVHGALKIHDAERFLPARFHSDLDATPHMHRALLASQCAGEAILRMGVEKKIIDPSEMDRVDTHVWTMHSLGMLKERNYRTRDPEDKRRMKFCERRHHEERVCRSTHRIATTSPEMAETLKAYYQFPFAKMFFFPPCIDRRLFRRYEGEPVERAFAWLSETSGLPVETLERGKILFETSRMDTSKRKDVLLRAFAKVSRAVPDAYLFIGGGPENEVFRDLKGIFDEEPSLAGRAFLTGFIPDEVLYPLFSLADLFVTASEMEGFGMSASQAAAAGTAIVSSDRIPFATQFAPEATAIVPAGDVEGFADAVSGLLLDDGLREEKANRLFEKTKGLSWPAVSRAFLEYLRETGIPVKEGKPAPEGGP